MRRQWPEPYTFKPERFAKDGENAGQDIWTFSTGPRIWYSSYLSD
jgi:cytochrome P450